MQLQFFKRHDSPYIQFGIPSTRALGLLFDELPSLSPSPEPDIEIKEENAMMVILLQTYGKEDLSQYTFDKLLSFGATSWKFENDNKTLRVKFDEVSKMRGFMIEAQKLRFFCRYHPDTKKFLAKQREKRFKGKMNSYEREDAYRLGAIFDNPPVLSREIAKMALNGKIFIVLLLKQRAGELQKEHVKKLFARGAPNGWKLLEDKKTIYVDFHNIEVMTSFMKAFDGDLRCLFKVKYHPVTKKYMAKLKEFRSMKRKSQG